MSEYDHTKRTITDEYTKKPKTDWAGVIVGGLIVWAILAAIF